MPLTWRNVDAPDFGRSMEGYRGFSNAFTDAINGLDRGLGRYDATLDDAANAKVLAQFAGAQDAAAAKAQLASLSTNPDFRRLSAATIGAVSARPGQLINEALAGTNLDAARFELGNARDDRATDQRVATGLQSYLRDGTPLDMTGLGINKVTGLVNARQNYVKGDIDIDAGRLGLDQTRLGMDVTREGLTQSRWNFQQQKDNAQLAKDVAAATRNIDLNAFDAASGEKWLRSQNFSPEVYNAIRGQIPALFGSSGRAGAAISSVLGGGDPTRVITGGGKGNLGIGSLPDSVQTQGDAVNFGKMLNNRGQESSATGLYQITQSTRSEFGAKALGPNWQNAPINAQTDDAIAQKIFESTGGDPTKLKGRWTSLKGMDNATLAKLAKGGWPAIRGVIAKGESGGDPQALLTNKFNADLGRSNKMGGTNANSIANDYLGAVADTTPIGDVAAKLISGPTYKGKTREQGMQMIQDVMTEAANNGRPISAALAAKVLERNPEVYAPSGWRKAMNTVGRVLDPVDFWGLYSNTPTVNPNRKGVSDVIKAITDGRVDDNLRANFDNAQVGAASKAAVEAYTTAQAQLDAATEAVNRGKNINLAPYRQARDAAFRAANGGQLAISQNPARATFGAPAMTPAAQAAWMRAVGRSPIPMR